jgi:hypothetical protein
MPDRTNRRAVAIDDETHARLEDLHRALGISRRRIVREAVLGFVLIRHLNEQLEDVKWKSSAPRLESRPSGSSQSPPFGPSLTMRRSDEQ